jgi:hypothetical protein
MPGHELGNTPESKVSTIIFEYITFPRLKQHLLFTAKQCCPSAASTASVHIETRKKE